MKKASDFLQDINDCIDKGPFRPAFESLENWNLPQWYQDAKFGIFIHWGVYSVPGFINEWYPRNMYIKATREYEHHIKTYGPHDKFGYKDFIPMFKTEKFAPAKWVDLFKKSGAKFVVPVAEHHDGFAMYDCSFSKWNARKMGPKRDIIKELAKATRDAGMTFGLSSHRAEHWFFMNGGMNFDSDVKNPKYQDFYGPAKPDNTPPEKYFLDDWLARTCELVDKYQPQLLWFDWWIEQPAFKDYLLKFAAYYYNKSYEWRQGVAINYKYHAYNTRSAVFDVERGSLADIRPYFWQTDTAVAKNSWSHIKSSAEGKSGLNYKNTSDLIGDLVDIVSKNGALLLNIGPRADGSIPAKDRQILLDIGKWLKTNGEAIYGTRPWKVYGEGPTDVLEGAFNDDKRQRFTGKDIRFTTKGEKNLYAIFLSWPGKEAQIRSLGSDMKLYNGKIEKISMLGCREKLEWQATPGGLKVKMPKNKPCNHAFTIKIENSKIME